MTPLSATIALERLQASVIAYLSPAYEHRHAYGNDDELRRAFSVTLPSLKAAPNEDAERLASLMAAVEVYMSGKPHADYAAAVRALREAVRRSEAVTSSG